MVLERDAVYIQPSIFSADFGYLADEAKRIEQAGADGIHVDMMDGHFVPNLALSPRALAAINRATDLYLDVHLMAYNPYDYVECLVANGADCITFHMEATEDVEDTLDYIRRCNVHAGLAFCPDTSESLIVKYLHQCDKLLLMTVHPGFSGQPFIHKVLEKIQWTRKLCNQLKIGKGGKSFSEGDLVSPFDIQVDGGIDAKTARLAIESGANHLVSGSYLFEGGGMKEKMARLRE